MLLSISLPSRSLLSNIPLSAQSDLQSTFEAKHRPIERDDAVSRLFRAPSKMGEETDQLSRPHKQRGPIRISCRETRRSARVNNHNAWSAPELPFLY